MNGLQIFAFVVLPIIVAAGGWIIAVIVAPADHKAKVENQSPSGSPQHRD